MLMFLMDDLSNRVILNALIILLRYNVFGDYIHETFRKFRKIF